MEKEASVVDMANRTSSDEAREQNTGAVSENSVDDATQACTPNKPAMTGVPMKEKMVEEALSWVFSVVLAGGERSSIFVENAKSLLLGLMLGMRDLSVKGEVSLCEADVRKHLEPDQFIKMATRDDVSPEAREAMQSCLESFGWKKDVPDRERWGDFNRQYSYAQNYALYLMNAIMKGLSEQQRKTETGYETPSRRLSLLVEGRDYLKYRETFERVLFAERMTPAQKDGKLLQLALACLVERMDALSVETGEPFVKAEMLAG
ncbi:MAG: hypothetical protein ACYCS8_16820 [Acidithiobacillus sp.]